MNVGKRIRELREKCGFSANRLADFAGIAYSHLRKVENGESDITVGHLQMICDALGITLSEFFSVEKTDEVDELAAAISSLMPKQRVLLIEFLRSL